MSGGREFELREIVALNLDDLAIRDLERLGFGVIEGTELAALTGRIDRLRLPPGLSEARAVELAQQTAPAASFDLNTLYSPRNQPDCDSNCLAEELMSWNSSAARCGYGLRVGMIDTAVAPDHPSLRAAELTTRIFRGRDRLSSAAEHGTAVASLLVGASDSGVPGLLPKALLFAADAFHARDDGDRADTLDLIRALDWLITEQVAVINMSFSGGANELLATAVEQSAQLGVILVGAAGDRLNGKVETFPAAYEAVVAVTAVDSRLRPYRAAARGAYLAFAAPGVDVPLARAGGGTVVQTGTSFAAPFVSAAFALLRGSDRDGDSETARALLRDAARDLGPPGRDPIFGWGLVRVPTTLRCGT